VHRRVAAIAAGALVAVSIAAFTVAPEAAFACSCEQTGTDADTVGFVDVAFVGEVVSTLTLDPPLRDKSISFDMGGLVWDVRYRVRVDEGIKGVSAGQLVIVYGSTMGSQCGPNTLRAGLTIPVALREVNTGGWKRFPADTEGNCGWPASVDGFRALAADVGEIPPFESPNIEPVGSVETDDGSFNPEAGAVSFVEPLKSAGSGLPWWPIVAVGVVLMGGVVVALTRGRRASLADPVQPGLDQ
jgi:hypothetical protein